MNNPENTLLPEKNITEEKAPVAVKKKKKGKMIAAIIIAVLIPLISAFTILSVLGIIVISELRSPEKAIMNMLEEGKYDEALARYHHEFSEEGASEELIDLLKDRASVLIDEIMNVFKAGSDNKAHNDNLEIPAFNELKAIMSMDIPEVNEYLRNSLLKDLAIVLFKYIKPDNLPDVPYIFEILP